jgi:putative RNA 2'-phosphotransferase
MPAESKLLSHLLRHRPEAAGLTLGPGGWVGLEELLAGLAQAGQGLDREALLRIVAEDRKERFTLSDDGERIRAAQGHSVEVDLGLSPVEPPERLYHGTAERNVATILAEGLKPGQRQHVHLSGDEATARAVGARHGRPVVLLVAAGAMHRKGRPFWRADNGVWLTEAVPPPYLSAP